MLNESDVVRLLFGFKLKYLRQGRGLSLEDLAAQSGLSKSYLHDLEKGKKYPKLDKIHTLAQALGVDYDYLVSRKISKKMQPVIDLLTSDLLKEFPLDDFGISTEKLVELLVNTPERVTAFISTVMHLIRHYQVEREHVYFTALRAYQNLHDNYFEELEEAALACGRVLGLPLGAALDVAALEQALATHYGVRTDRQGLPAVADAQKVRAYYAPRSQTLYMQPALSAAQQRFVLARELGFQYMQWQPRPLETRILEVPNFELLLHNFQASYFASALMMPEADMVADIRAWANEPSWQPERMTGWLGRYHITPEMLLQRLSNLLPRHFGLYDLFFIRLQAPQDLLHFRMTKELHLAKPQSPSQNALDEHYCRRWVSVNAIKQARQEKHGQVVVQAQLSEYWQQDVAYFCVALAQTPANGHAPLSSVTLGLLVNEASRSTFRFLSDPALPLRTVGTTCERCTLPDCEARLRPALALEGRNDRQLLLHALKQLDGPG